jgi:hypothetical protein
LDIAQSNSLFAMKYTDINGSQIRSFLLGGIRQPTSISGYCTNIHSKLTSSNSEVTGVPQLGWEGIIMMESDTGKRARGNSIATTNSPPANNDGGSMATAQVGGETRSQSLDIHLEPQSYDIETQKTKSTGNPFPRNHPNWALISAERLTRSSMKDQRPALEPPVTKGTLSELDVNKIVNNPKLRHDINFDPDLHFRPNLDGEKGRRKTQKANDFWDTMRAQLREYLMHREQFESELGDIEWCLPATLKAIRGILETLVPQRDRASVEETFNVDLLMQQFRKGVADLVKLALWLSQLLKCHCAPMRDDWVDEMVTQLSNGDRNGDVNMLVGGMQNLLGVLEAMKLVSSF